MSEKIRWQCVNDEPFEYAVQQGPHGDEFVKLLDGTCLRRASSPAQEPRFDSVAQRIERSEPDEGRRDAGSNPVAIGPAQEPVTTEPVAWRYQRKEWDALLWRYQTEALVNDDFETPSDWLIEPLYAIPAPPQPGRAWQPIETAPSDGTQVLVCGGYLDGVQMRGAAGDWWRMSKKDGNRATPTHWQSLPTPYTGEPK